MILLGTISTRFAGHQAAFAAGAASSSFLFFFSLGYGAAWLRPIFSRPVSWRILETIIACVMWLIAFKLLNGMTPRAFGDMVADLIGRTDLAEAMVYAVRGDTGVTVIE